MDNALLPVLSLLVGAVLGLSSTLIVSRLQQRNTVTLRLLEEYFQVRKELVDGVSALMEIPRFEELSEQDLLRHRQAISRIYFKHYDFLPSEVAEALLLLHACLLDGKGKLFKLVGDGVLPIKGDKEVEEFITHCSRTRNTRMYAPGALRSLTKSLRFSEAAKLHAQNVLYTLNKFASIEDLLRMTRRLRKDRITYEKR